MKLQQLQIFQNLTEEELEKRLSGLLRIYRPEKEFAEDALTRSILDEFEYLKGRLPEKAKDV